MKISKRPNALLVGSMRHHAAQGIPIYLVVIALAVFTGLFSEHFFTVGNIQNLAERMSPLALLALGQTIAILVGGIDLSVGAVVSLITVVLSFTGRDATLSILPALLLCLLIGLVVGVLNGMGAVYLRLDPLIASLAMSAIVQGVALIFRQSPGGSVYTPFALFLGSRIAGIPVNFLLTLLIYVLVWILLSFTRFGRSVYAVGGNQEHARQSGIDVARVKILASALVGLLASLAGILLAARIYSGDPVIGNPMTLDSVAGAIVGGTPFPGGSGGPVGTLAGAMLLTLIGNLLNMLNVAAYYQYIIKGLILAGALVFYYSRKRRETAHAG